MTRDLSQTGERSQTPTGGGASPEAKKELEDKLDSWELYLGGDREDRGSETTQK